MNTRRPWFQAFILVTSVTLLGPAAIARADKPDNHGKKAAHEEKHVVKHETKVVTTEERHVVKKDDQSQVRAQAKRNEAVQRQRVEEQRVQQARAEQQRQEQVRAEQLRQQHAAQLRQQQEAARVQQQRTRTSQTRTVQRARLSQARQQQLINEQRQRNTAYAQQLQRQADLARQRSLALQRQRRLNQYRFQQQYLLRLQQQQEFLRSQYNYNNDPFYYTAPSYRYSRAGTYYQVNQYAADQLRQAVNLGYEEGLRAGQADRADGWRFDYQNSYAYQDANYGYTGRYVSQNDYNYYFREGLRRGYEDGYYSRAQYGQQSNGTVNLLAAVLQGILNIQPLQ